MPPCRELFECYCLFECYYLFLIYNLNSSFSTRLEARIWPNIGFTLRDDLPVFTRSAITLPRVH